jgi:hypothetical protein
MKAFVVLLLGLFYINVQAATSDMLSPNNGGVLMNAPGNVIFNGNHFVSPTVVSNGAIYLTLLDSNGFAVSESSLSITGSSPRVAFNGTRCVLAWIATNSFPNTLVAAQVSNGNVQAVSALGTNVADETLSLNTAGSNLLVVWQSAGSNSSVFARAMNFSGAGEGETFAVGPSPLPQRYPSIDNDGTNHLVCWMQQNDSSNDWRVVAQRITAGAISGTPVQVSETNSMRPYPTACSFGTNFLVAWSMDEAPITTSTNEYCCFEGGNILRRPMVHGRMVSESAVPLRHEMALVRRGFYSTNVALAYCGDRYVLSVFTWWKEMNGYPTSAMERQFVHFLNADGSRRASPTQIDYPFIYNAPLPQFIDRSYISSLKPRCVAGFGGFCILFQATATTVTGGYSVILTRRDLPEFRIPYRREANKLTLPYSPNFVVVEISTNLINWEQRSVYELPFLGARPSLFIRASSSQLTCIENLRAIHWAKQNWAYDFLKKSYQEPDPLTFFGPNGYFAKEPLCPDFGGYTRHGISDKPTCSVTGHTL